MTSQTPRISESLQHLAVDIDSLVHDPANARKHDERNIAAIKASLARFGQVKPVVVADNGVTVIAGNGTLQAAKELGWDQIAAATTTLDGSEATAYAIADNKTAELAEWDDDVLAQLIDALPGELQEVTGFDAGELEEMLVVDAGDVVEDEVPEPPKEPVTKRGDLILLGDHRLLCGDSTNADDVARLMDGEKADLLLTDPPYNVDYEGGTGLRIENDSMGDEEFRMFLVSSFRSAFDSMKSGASFYVWHADAEGFNFRGAIRDCNQIVRQCLIWAKSALVMGRQDYQWQHEPCLYGWKGGSAHKWYGDRKQTTLLSFDKPQKNVGHPTVKPLLLFTYLVENSTLGQDLAYDPFLGSGTTLIACEQLDRRCYGMEIDPAYCDVIVQRWENMTGQKATVVEGEHVC